MLDRDKEGILTMDSKAALMIAGMPPDDMTNTLQSLEKLYQDWLGVKVDPETGHILRTSWITGPRRLILKLAAAPIRIFRSQVYELVKQATAMIQAKRAENQRQEFYGAYLQVTAREKELQKFLFEHFRDELARGQALDHRVIDIAKEIMLRTKEVSRG